MGDGLQAYNLDNKDIDLEDDDPFKEYITGVAFVICCAYPQTHEHSPRQIVFGRDMFLPVENKIDWEKIFTQKQDINCKSNEHKNSKHIDHNYQKGDWVTLIQLGEVERILAIRCNEPYKVVK